MQCSYCREDIFDGAKVCRYCGRDQPLTWKEKKTRREARNRKLWIIVPSTLGGLFVILMIWAMMFAADQQRKVNAAAACASDTPEHMEALAVEAAKKGDLSIAEAENALLTYTCGGPAR